MVYPRNSYFRKERKSRMNELKTNFGNTNLLHRVIKNRKLIKTKNNFFILPPNKILI